MIDAAEDRGLPAEAFHGHSIARVHRKGVARRSLPDERLNHGRPPGPNEGRQAEPGALSFVVSGPSAQSRRNRGRSGGLFPAIPS